VFYWFSVPHDRLFLDALERDLKREKMNQEPTTRATAEPALSFYYDSSMTLFDQLTKAVQQSNSSASSLTMNRARDQGMGDYRTHSRQHSRQASDLMPPPPQMSQMPHPHEEYASYIMQDNNHQLDLEPSASIVQRQLESSPFVPMPYGQQNYRSAAMSCPPFAGVEYSPAPSFGTGHISPDEYAQGRAMTYAPETPPQSQQGIYGMNNQTQHYGLLPTPEASISGDVYTPHSIIFLDRSNLDTMNMRRPSIIPEPMGVLQGSPTYKQRRRRTSISQHMNMIGNNIPGTSTQFGHRRAASVADGSLRNTLLNQGFQRHTTPLRDSPYQRTSTPVSHLQQPIFNAHEELAQLQMEHDERYTSASPMDMRASSVTPGAGDGPAKTFTCPVPTCGRLFKRLEHLKRHVRTHTQERPYICGVCAKKFSRSDNLAQYVPLLVC
jgi:transcription factor STE12